MRIENGKAIKEFPNGDRLEIEDLGDRVMLKVYGKAGGRERLLDRREITHRDMVGSGLEGS